MTTSPIKQGQEPPVTIRSDRLTVEIARPGTVYNRTRFDWTSFVTQVKLDGVHTFCVPEDYNPAAGTGGIGLCCEFSNSKTVGFDDAQPGECFTKPGIGHLVKTEDPAYSFFKPYQIAQNFAFTVSTGDDEARFIVEPADCRGYAARLVRTYRVQDNCLWVTCTLENTGSRPIHTHEYNHNFVGIDQQPVGPDYLLRFPYTVRFEKMSSNFRNMLPRLLRKITPDFILQQIVNRRLSLNNLVFKGGDVRWNAVPDKAFFFSLLGYFKTDQPQWELVHLPSGVGMRELDDFTPVRVYLWGVSHVVSAEVYVDIDLEPGQSQTWTRKYEFFSRS